jgi:hypothetical protein
VIKREGSQGTALNRFLDEATILIQIDF